MNLSLTDAAIVVNDGYTVLPATEDSVPLRDLVYAHHLRIDQPPARPVRRRRAARNSTARQQPATSNPQPTRSAA